jgi:hypothetical protein
VRERSSGVANRQGGFANKVGAAIDQSGIDLDQVSTCRNTLAGIIATQDSACANDCDASAKLRTHRFDQLIGRLPKW